MRMIGKHVGYRNHGCCAVNHRDKHSQCYAVAGEFKNQRRKYEPDPYYGQDPA